MIPLNVDGPVDHIAVDWAIAGTPMSLNREEQKLAVKAMYGKQSVEDIRRLIGAKSDRQIHRLAREVGL